MVKRTSMYRFFRYFGVVSAVLKFDLKLCRIVKLKNSKNWLPPTYITSEILWSTKKNSFENRNSSSTQLFITLDSNLVTKKVN